MLSKNQIKRIQSLARKKGRREEGCFIAEGNKLVEDTLSAFECDLILATPSWIVSHAHESMPPPWKIVPMHCLIQLEKKQKPSRNGFILT